MGDDLLRPIIGIENRTPLEVFDIMCDRFRSHVRSSGSYTGAGENAVVAIVEAIANDEIMPSEGTRRLLALLSPTGIEQSEAYRGLQAERDRLREALEASEYLEGLYERLWKGGVVRDLPEAIACAKHARAVIGRKGEGDG